MENGTQTETLITSQEASEAQAKLVKIKTEVEQLLQEYGQTKLLADHKDPLVKGFKNNKVVLPVLNLQKRIEEIEDRMTNNLRQISRSVSEQIQNCFQYAAQLAEANNKLSETVEALTTILNVKETDLATAITNLQAERAKEKEAEEDKKANRVVVTRPSQEGDTVKIDFVGKLDETPFPGGKGTGFNLKLGSKQFIPGFEEQLVGKSAGEKVDVKVTFPVDYGNKDLAGKEATFETTVLSVKETAK